jgi:hypothetical protein
VEHVTMLQFVSEDAEAVRDSPTEGATVDLVVRVSEASLADAETWVMDHDGEVIDALDHGLLEVTLPETAVGDLCDREYVSSVERADEMIGVLDQGN